VSIAEKLKPAPVALAEGERLLWEGAPAWRGLLVRLFHARAVAVYFAALLLWHSARVVLNPGASSGYAPLWLMAAAALTLGLLLVLAWLTERTTRYVLTDRRVVLRFGIALPMTLNIPLSAIHSAAVRLLPDGSGDIPLFLGGHRLRLGYIPLWPHVRPWRLAEPQPMLRAVAGAAGVAALLGEALHASAEGSAAAPGARDVDSDACRPVREVREPALAVYEATREVREPVREAYKPVREVRDPGRDAVSPGVDHAMGGAGGRAMVGQS